MIIGEEWFMIRELHRQGLNISDIARKTNHDRKTVRKIIAQEAMPKFKERPKQPSKLDPFKNYLKQRMDLEVFNCVKLLREIAAMGYSGSSTILRDYVKPFRQNQKATMRYETLPGEQAQVDWGVVGKLYDTRGVLKTVYCFVMTLGYSRYAYVEFTFRADTRAFIRGHINAFAYFEGIPKEILYDNTKCAKLVYQDGKTVLNPLFADFASTFGFAPKFCKPYRPQTKGKVESGIKYVKGNFVLGETFLSIAQLNEKGLSWLENVANLRVHGTTAKVVKEAYLEEKDKLFSLKSHMVFDTALYLPRKITRDCLVSYENCRYSMPHAYASKICLVKDTGDDLLSFLVDSKVVATHRKSLEAGKTIIVSNHYQGIDITQTKSRKILPLLNKESLPKVAVRPLSYYEAMAGGSR